MSKAEKIIDLLDKELCLFARDFADLGDFAGEVLEMITKIIMEENDHQEGMGKIRNGQGDNISL